MRDLAILIIFGVGLLYAIRSPFVGLMVYMWISVMNPHRYAWGFAYNLPLAQVAAIVTMVGMALKPDQIRFPRTREAYLFLLLWAWISLTTVFAIYPVDARPAWQIVMKIFLMVFVSMLLINSRVRLIYYVLGLVAFVGFMSVKGALFGILTRGQFRVWGPDDSFIADNNSAALAMVMIVPFCFYIRGVVKQKWLSRVLLGVGLSSIVSVLLTYSRGGMLGLAAVGVFSVLYSRRKFRVGAVAAVLVIIGLIALPPAWMDRMSTIGEYEEDNSAKMRLNSWSMAYNLAKHNPLGGGFACFTMDQYYRYAPEPELGRTFSGHASTAHSIYFEVMAMHGFGGLLIFLACLLSIILSMRRVQRFAAEERGADEVVAIARAFTISVVGFMVSGAFLSRAFFDLFWSIFAASLCFKSLVLEGKWNEEEAPRDALEVSEAQPLLGASEASLKPNRET